MADYSHYATVASEWQEFEKIWSPPIIPAGTSLEKIRELANAGNAKSLAAVLGVPNVGLRITDLHVESTNGAVIPVRLYIPEPDVDKPLATYITFHGGGYHLGNLETEDPWARQIALTTGLAVLNVNYRHTPEHVFPAPVHDAYAVYAWTQTAGLQYNLDPKRVFVGGSSAGATLAIAVALWAHNKHQCHPVRGLVLSVPSVVHPDLFPEDAIKDSFSSLKQNENSPFIDLAKLRRFLELYRPDSTIPSVSPLLLDDDAFRGLAPTSIHIAGRDPLRDEGLLFETKLRAAGVKTRLTIYPGLPHAFMSLPLLPSSEKWRQAVQKDLRDLKSDTFA